MTNHSTREGDILAAVKRALTQVIRDTATPPGLIHPLKDDTINDLRQALVLISVRERELALGAGQESEQRPYYTDEARDSGSQVVHFVRTEKPKA